MTDFLIEQAVGIVAYLVVILIGALGAWLTSKIAKKTELANIKTATEAVIQMAQQTVNELQQTTVEAWKAAAKDGKLTESQIDMLREEVLDITEAKLCDAVKGLLVAAKVDLETLIQSAAESYISTNIKYM